MDKYILNIETSSTNCSVSLFKNALRLHTIEENNKSFSHSEQLHCFIQELLEKKSIPIQKIDAVAVSKGPGSYTGLRIGVSAAKGLCYALGIPLISICTLQAIAKQTNPKSGDTIIAILDARRNDLFLSVMDSNYVVKIKPIGVTVNNTFYKTYFENKNFIHLIGTGIEKIEQQFNLINVKSYNNVMPSSKTMGDIAFDKFNKKEFENLVSFEPLYLRV